MTPIISNDGGKEILVGEEVWITVTLQEYMNSERDPNYVPPKITKFKKWRTKTAEKFWYKLHRVAEEHGACDGYWD